MHKSSISLLVLRSDLLSTLHSISLGVCEVWYSNTHIHCTFTRSIHVILAIFIFILSAISFETRTFTSAHIFSCYVPAPSSSSSSLIFCWFISIHILTRSPSLSCAHTVYVTMANGANVWSNLPLLFLTCFGFALLLSELYTLFSPRSQQRLLFALYP